MVFAENTLKYSGELYFDSLYVISTKDDNTKEYIFSTASTVIHSSNIPPTISVHDTLDVFLVQPGTILYGWVKTEAEALLSGLDGNVSTAGVPSWKIQLQSDNNNIDSCTYTAVYLHLVTLTAMLFSLKFLYNV